MKANLSFGWLDYESEDESPLEKPWSEVNECVPLKLRLKMLRAKDTSKNRNEVLTPALSQADDAVNKDFYLDQDGGKGRSVSASCKQGQNGIVHTNRNSSFQNRMLSERLEKEYKITQVDSVTYFPNGQQSSSSDDIENSEYFNENLDHVSLKERRRMLLSSCREVVRPIRRLEFISPDPSTSPVGISSQNSRSGSDNRGIRSATTENFIYEKGSCKAFKHGSVNGIDAGIPTWKNQHKSPTKTKPQNFKKVCNEATTCTSGRSDINEKRLLSKTRKDLHTVGLNPFPNVKVETPDDVIEIHQITIKDEAMNSSESLEDIIDHMMLGDRIRLLSSRKFPKTVFKNFETGNDQKSKLPKSCTPLAIKKPRKRRRTATDCIETALEEDAPGLLKVLIEKGVLVDEIKLYGANEGDEPLDESLMDESFSDLEDVITKIFSQQQSLFKFAPIRCGRGEKTTYCLSCLISLVDQARHLRLKSWPVEWGWCRDLQSFIFVFNRHNRIVLERPEYGYATYFFELVDALPVNWQIKRLVTAMKLTSCTRITLIENRALRVGDDLTEGEARVLMEFGWIPNSGLGTMLNYCDRVVHDRKNDSESDSSEWRSKIGKLLTDGFNGGIIVPNDIPKRVMEYGIGHTPEIKLEY